MQKILSVCALAVGAVLLSAMPLAAQTLFATMNGAEETPALLTGAVANITVNVDQSAQTVEVELIAFNLPTGTTAGHIHIGPLGQAGPVVIDFPIPTGRTDDLNLRFRVGAAEFHARPEIGINTISDAIQAIINGNSYANIHTSGHPGGEIRGQLRTPERVLRINDGQN
jgi:hypothetical protein